MSNPEDCPRFDKCSAPICPLDKDWRARVHQPGDAVCGFMLEAVKNGATARFRGSPHEDIVHRAAEVASRTEILGTSIRSALKRAALTGSRFDSGARLADAMAATGATTQPVQHIARSSLPDDAGSDCAVNAANDRDGSEGKAA